MGFGRMERQLQVRLDMDFGDNDGRVRQRGPCRRYLCELYLAIRRGREQSADEVHLRGDRVGGGIRVALGLDSAIEYRRED